jgi:hypothetical protein
MGAMASSTRGLISTEKSNNQDPKKRIYAFEGYSAAGALPAAMAQATFANAAVKSYFAARSAS